MDSLNSTDRGKTINISLNLRIFRSSKLWYRIWNAHAISSLCLHISLNNCTINTEFKMFKQYRVQCTRQLVITKSILRMKLFMRFIKTIPPSSIQNIREHFCLSRLSQKQHATNRRVVILPMHKRIMFINDDLFCQLHTLAISRHILLIKGIAKQHYEKNQLFSHKIL